MFTPEHRRGLERDGFTRVEGVIPDEPLDRLLAALAGISRLDLGDPSTWYLHAGVIPVCARATQGRACIGTSTRGWP